MDPVAFPRINKPIMLPWKRQEYIPSYTKDSTWTYWTITYRPISFLKQRTFINIFIRMSIGQFERRLVSYCYGWGLCMLHVCMHVLFSSVLWCFCLPPVIFFRLQTTPGFSHHHSPHLFLISNQASPHLIYSSFCVQFRGGCFWGSKWGQWDTLGSTSCIT